MTTALSAIAFTSDIARLTENFTGRQWVFDDIDRWLKESEERFFILTGEPGVGKSAITARLTQIRDDVAAYHFCRANDVETVRPARILRSLAAQLGEHLTDYGQALANTIKPIHLRVEVNITIGSMTGSQVTGVYIEYLKESDPENELDILIRAPLEELQKMYAERQQAQPNLAIILIDSLDEAVTTTGTNLVKLLTQLSKSTSLPSWIRFVMTSRPERRVLRGFKALKPYQLQEKSNESLSDIREYVNNRVAQPALQNRLQRNQVQPQTLISEITNLSHGNFLYTTLLLKDIEAGRQALDNLAALPKSIDDIYHGFLSRFSEEDWSKRYKPIFGVLTVAQEPISERQISSFTKIDPEDVRDSIKIARQFFDGEIDEHTKETYSIFHQSLRDYLLDEDRNPDFWCNARKQHQRITDYYWHYQEKKKWSECDRYGLQHLPIHLVSLANLKQGSLDAEEHAEKLYKLLLTFDWLQVKLKVINVGKLLEDFDLLLNTGIDEQPIRLVKKAIRLSAHLLTQYPSLLWQQLYGRLIPFDIPEIQALLAPSPKGIWFRPVFASLVTASTPLVCSFEGHSDRVTTIVITPDGKQALSASEDGTLGVWDLKSGICLKILSGHHLAVRDVVVGSNKEWTESDEKWAVSASDDGTIKLWDLQTGECLKSKTLSEKYSVTALAVTTDSQVFVASNDSTVKLWNWQTDEFTTLVQGHSGEISTMVVTHNGQIFLGGLGATLQRWDLQRGECQMIVDRTEIDGARRYLQQLSTTVVITSDGNCALSLKDLTFYTGSDSLIELWDLQAGTCKPPQNLNAPNALQHFETLAITPDGKYAILGDFEGKLQRWNLQTGECQPPFQGHNRMISALAITHDGSQAISSASYGDSNILKLWDLQAVNNLETSKWHRAAVTAVAIYLEGKQVVSASLSDLKIWDLQTGACLKTIDLYLNDLNTIIPLDNDYSTTKTISDFKLNALQRACGLAAQQRQAVEISTGSLWGLIASGNTLRLLNFQTEMDQEIDKNISLGEAMAISSNGKWAAIGLKNHNLEIWNLQTKDCQLTLKRIGQNWLSIVLPELHKRKTALSFPSVTIDDVTLDSRKMQIQAVAVSPDGEQAIVGCGYTLELWNLQTKNFKILAASYEAPLRTTAVMFTSDCRRAISISKDRTLKLWDLINGECITIWGGDSPILSCAISSDDSMVVVGEESGRLHFLKLEGI